MFQETHSMTMRVATLVVAADETDALIPEIMSELMQ